MSDCDTPAIPAHDEAQRRIDMALAEAGYPGTRIDADSHSGEVPPDVLWRAAALAIDEPIICLACYAPVCDDLARLRAAGDRCETTRRFELDCGVNR